MAKTLKKLGSFALALLMVLSLVPFGSMQVFAAEETATTGTGGNRGSGSGVSKTYAVDEWVEVGDGAKLITQMGNGSGVNKTANNSKVMGIRFTDDITLTSTTEGMKTSGTLLYIGYYNSTRSKCRDQVLVIDLNGKTLTVDETVKLSRLFGTYGNSQLTIINGTISMDGTYTAYSPLCFFHDVNSFTMDGVSFTFKDQSDRNNYGGLVNASKSGASITIRNSDVTVEGGSVYRGGMVNTATSGITITLENSNFTGGKVRGGSVTSNDKTTIYHARGGQFYIASGSTLNATNCSFAGGVSESSDAETYESQGGNIFGYGTAKLNLTNCTLKDGQAANGGNLGVSEGAVLKLDGTTISGGKATCNGGNLWATVATITMDNSTITGGEVTTEEDRLIYGGNVYLNGDEDGCVFTMNSGTISDGTVSGNCSSTEAYIGGGNIYATTKSTVKIYGGTISGGRAYNKNTTKSLSIGGNIYVTVGTSTLDLYEGVTVTGGRAESIGTDGGRGGNIGYSSARVNIRGAIISNGTATHRGGNLFSPVTSSKLYIYSGIIENGTAENDYGGNLYFNGQCYIYDVTIRGGTCKNSTGAAIWVASNASAKCYIYGGNFLRTGSSAIYKGANGTLKIYSGVFAANPKEEYVVADCSIRPTAKEADGYYHVYHKDVEGSTTIVEPTCTTDGSKTIQCLVCGSNATTPRTYTYVIPATGHTEIDLEAKAPTCTETGLTAGKKCEVCGEITVKQETVAATGHTEEIIPGQAATCENKGLSDGKKCATCGEILKAQEEIGAIGHKWDEGKVTTAPTCTEDGVRTYTCENDPNHKRTEVIKATGHSYSKVVTPPTCTKEGYTTYTCTCGDSYIGDKKPATGHTYSKVVTAPTHTEKGYTTYTCTCGDSYVADYVDATGHSWGNGVVTSAPTCTEDGVRTYTCSCGETKTAAEPATGHTAGTAVKENVVAATCTTAGSYDMVTKCTKCDAITKTESYVIDALGHTVGNTEKQNNNPATCTADGSYDTVTFCGRCGVETKRETTVVPATGHKEVTIAAVAAGCETTGLTAGKKCDTCGDILVAQQVVPAKGHNYNAGVVTTKPSCETAGVKTFTCQNDSKHYYTEEIAPIGHAYDEGKITTAPTCEGEGVKTYTCGNDAKHTYTVAVAAIGHAYNEGVITTAPTCTEAGVKTFTCANDKTHTYTEAVEATGHEEGETVVENKKDATCTVAGSYDNVVYCSVCHAELSRETVPVSETGHTYDAGVRTEATTEADAYTTYTCTNGCGHSYVETHEGTKLPAFVPVAMIGETPYESLQAALAAAVAGDKIVLAQDVTLTELVKIEKPVTLDLNGKTITANCKKAIEVYADATITGGTIIGENRCVDTRKAVSLTLDGVKLVADNYTSAYSNPQPLTIGGSENGTVLTVRNSEISAKDGYGIIVFVDTEATIENTTISGYNSLYMKDGSQGSQINFVDCDLTGDITHNDVSGNSFSIIAIQTSDVTVHADAATTFTVKGTYYYAVSIGSVARSICTGNSVTILGTIDGNIVDADDLKANTLVVSAAYADTLKASGYSYKVNSDGTITAKPALASVVAKIGDTEYATLAEAVADAANGQTIVLVEDVELEGGIVIEGKTVTLDLNGHTISGTDNNTAGNFYLINNNKGNLTIDDSVGGGKITLTATNERNWSASSVAVANNLGTVTVKGGTIEHLGGTSMAYAIDNLTNGKGTVATLNIEGGTVKSSYFAIRQFANNGTNNLNITGGNVQYTWMQSPNSNANVANISITGGSVEGVCLTGNNAVLELNVAPNTTGTVYGTAPAGQEILGSPETGFSLGSVVAKIGETEYFSLQDAIAAVEDGGTIVLVSDLVFTEATRTHNSGTWYDGLYYVGDKSFTLDLGGYTITHDGSVNDYLLNFKNDGTKANTITLKNGTVDAGTSAYCAICTSSASTQKITINLEDINLINNISNGSVAKIRGGAELNVKAGTVITGKNSYLGIEAIASTVNIYDGAEIYMNGTSSYNGCLVGVGGGGVVNVYGGYGKGVRGGFIAMTSGGTINISGGEWIANTDGTVGNNSNLYVLTAQNNSYESGYVGASIINVTGGTLRGGMDAWCLNTGRNEVAQLNISGGNFNANPSGYLVEGCVASQTEGIWTVGKVLLGKGTEAEPYLIRSLEDLVFFRDSVNAGETKYNASGVYVALAADIDLNNEEWAPIGTSTIPFKGIFDGQNHTISNLVVTGGKENNKGLFGYTTDGEIKNLTVHNAKVSGRLNVAVVAGTPYTSNFTNIKVTGHVEVNGLAYVGGVGGKNAYGNWTDITVDVDETSYVKAVSTENGNDYRTYVGGVIGFLGEGNHTFKNISSNIRVEGNVADIGGLFGIAHYGNNFENVTFTGSVVAPEGAEEVGGIAGVWHNEKGYTVTFEDVTSTGTVTVGDETTTGSVVGGAYNPANDTAATSGSLIIEGKEAWLKTVQVGENLYVDLESAAAAATAGDTITLLADVTLSAELTLPADITLNGNGYQINGTIYAGGNLTIAGHTRVTAFSASYYNRVITIGEGACLEITGTGRVSLAYGNVFNITGSIENAKTADKSQLQASLIIPGGISITGGNDAAMNVTNAYVVIGNTSSKNNSANGTFQLNFVNSVVDFTNQFTLATPTSGKNPTFQVNITDSVMTVATKLCVAAPNSTVIVDNSVVTMGTYLRNSGELTLRNGAQLTAGMIQFGENGGNDGIITVDASQLTINNTNMAHAMDGNNTGILNVVNGGTADIDYMIETAIVVDTESSLIAKEIQNTCSITVDAENYDATDKTIITLTTGLTEAQVAAITVNGKAQVKTSGTNVVVGYGLVGSGTEADPYQISDAQDLFYFAKMVNNGTFKNVHVKLMANIDLEQEDWTSIGTASNPFTGVFDGNGMTISNLWTYGKGLFGYTSTGNYVESGSNGRATIKNLTVENATVINQSAMEVGGIVGQANQNTVVSGVNLIGEIMIYGSRFVGGIVGQGYVVIDNCHVDGISAEDSVIDANVWAVAGIVGHAGSESGSSITNCSVKNVTINTAHYGAGAIAGVGTYGPISNVTAENVEIEGAYEADAHGVLVGCNYATITGDSYAKNVNLTVGGTVVAVAQDIVAVVNGVQYATVASAIAHAQSGDTVTIVNDATITEKIEINKNLTLDLNGKTITTKDVVSSRVFVLTAGCTEFVINGNGGAINAADAKSYGIFDVTTDADVTVNGGSYDFDTNNGSLFKFRSNNVTITLNDVTVETNGQISGPDKAGNTLIVNGGSFKAENGYNVRNVFAFYVAKGNAEFNNMTMANKYVGGIEDFGGNVTLNNCNISVIGTNSSPFLSVAVAVDGMGNLTINGGNYATRPAAASDANGQGNTHGSWTVMIMSSGGTLTINDGTFTNGVYEGTATYGRSVLSIGADTKYGSNVVADLIINGGTFTSVGSLVDCETIWDQDGNGPATAAEKITITAGDFTGVSGRVIGGCDPISTGNAVEIEIAGGTYAANHAIDNSYLAVGYIVSANGDNTYSVVDDPSTVYISNLEELKAFRDSVNAGNTHKGVTVYLTADIDLAGENWAPIGSDKNHAFQGTFDGQSNTISNLTINDADLDCAGLFGYATGATIKNVYIENVNINAYSHVAAVVGNLYTGNVDNCHVSGNIKLVAQYAYAAGIAADGYNNISNCSVIADGMGEITVVEKTGAGGITGWRGEGNLTIKNCVVKNLEITAWASLGGITGILQYNNVVDGCTVENVKLTKTRVNGQASVGIVSGNWTNKADDNYTITVTNNSFDNISINGTAITSLNQLCGSNYSYYDKQIKLVESGNTFGSITTDFEIAVSTAAELKNAVAYVKDGETIKLLADIVLDTTLVIEGKTITLDLNGHTISGTDNNTAGNFYLINNNKGNLTIEDSVGGGKISLTATNERNWSASSVAVANTQGTVTVKGGTIEHLGGTSMAYAIDNLTNGANTVATLNIEGGNVESTYFAIRQFANGGTNNLNITGGNVQYAWMQSPNNNANVANISVTGGQVEGICLTGKNAVLTLDVAANTTGEVYGTAPAGQAIYGSTATGFGLSTAVAEVNGTRYASIQDALNAAEDGQTVTLLTDVSLTAADAFNTTTGRRVLLAVEGKSITLDMNGKTIDVEHLSTNDLIYSVVYIGEGAGLDVTGNGTIDVEVNYDAFMIAYLFWMNGTTGHLTIEDGYYHMNNAYDSIVYTNGDEIVTINGGTYILDAIGTRTNGFPCIFNTAGSNNNNVIVCGGTFNADVNHQYWAYEVVVVDGKAVVPTGNGTWTVVESEAYVIEGRGRHVGYPTLADALAAAEDGQTVGIVKAGTYELATSGKDLTIVGAVDGVVFDNIGRKNLGGANITFENVTFDYYPNTDYTGLQHSGNLTYNNCTFNGQVFLYGTSEIFNNCTFNQDSADAYNVWTYAAAYVEFNDCTFNSAGKALLIYTEDPNTFNTVVVEGTTFNATAPVTGKAAIEMDSSMSAGINLTINDSTANGFDNGSVSGNTLWNNKRGNETAPNNDITVTVGGEVVLAPLTMVAKVGNVEYTTLQAAINAAQDGQTVTLISDISLTGADAFKNAAGQKVLVSVVGKSITLDMNGKTIDVEHLSTNDLIYSVVYIGNGAGLDVTGNGTIDVEIDNDTYQIAYLFWMNGTTGHLTIENGTYHMNNAYDSIVYSNGDENVTVNGGTFILDAVGTRSNGFPCIFSTAGRNAYNIVVNGGTFNDDVNHQYWANEVLISVDKAVKDNGDGTWTIVDSQVYITEDGRQVGYATLADAIAACEADETITLLGDLNMTAPVMIDKSLSIDGNGYSITSNASRVIRITASDVDVTLSNLDLISNAVRVATADIRGISIDPDLSNVELTLNDCSVDFTDASATDWSYAVNVCGNSTNNVVTINGGTYEGANVINIWGNNHNIVVDGATLTSLYQANALYHGGCVMGNETSGVTVEISNSTFNGVHAVAVDLREGDTYTGTNNTDNTKRYVVEMNGQLFYTIGEAVKVAPAGATINLLHDVTETETINIAKDITINGNGYAIYQADSFTGNIAMFELYGGANVTFKNLTVDGVKNIAVMRSVGANVTIDNCVIQNCQHTAQQGMLRLALGDATITNSSFLNNSATMLISFGYDAANATDDLVIDNCLFQGNTAKETAIVYYADGAGATINDCEFISNTLTSAGNAATIYLGFTENNVVTGNLFQDNTVTITGTSVRGAGAIFFGYEAEVSENAFIGNTAVNGNGDQLGQVCTSLYYDCTIDLSENYWGSQKPVYGADYTLIHQTGPADFQLDTYYITYSFDAEGNVVMGETKNMPTADITYSAYGFNVSGTGADYRENFQIDLESINAYENLKLELYSNGILIATVTLREADRDDANDLKYPVVDGVRTANVVITGKASGSWDTVWHVAPSVDYIPDTVKVYADGVLADVYENIFEADDAAAYSSLPGVYKSIIATDENGNVTYYTNLDDLFAADLSGEVTVELLESQATSNKVDTAADTTYNFVTNVAGGVTMDWNYGDNWNYVQKMTLGENITLNVPYLVIWNKLDVYGNVNTDYAYFYSGNSTIAEGATLNVTTGDKTVQVKNGTVLTVNGTVNTDTLNVWNGASELIVSGANAQLNARWIDIWSGTPSVLVENGATLNVTGIKVSRGGIITVDAATLITEELTVGHTDSIGTVIFTNGGTLQGTAKLVYPGSTITGPTGLDVISGVNGYAVTYANGVYRLGEVVATVTSADGQTVTGYASLADAVAAVKNKETITLLVDNDEDISITQQKSLSFTIDGNGNAYTGTFTIDGNRRNTGAEKLTFKNIHFVADTNNQVFIDTVKNRYAHNIIVDGCTFDGNGKTGVYGMVLRHAYDIVVRNTTGTGMYDLVYGSYMVSGITVENVTVTNSYNGIVMNNVIDGVYKNITMDVTDDGIALGNSNASTAVIENVNITAKRPVVLAQVSTSKAFNVEINGTNTLTGTEGAEIYVIGTDAKLTVTANDSALVDADFNGTEAKIGNVYYNTLKKAISAATAGDTVALVTDVAADVTISKNITLDGNGKTLTGTVSVAAQINVNNMPEACQLKLTDLAATVTGAEELNVVSGIDTHVVVFENGVHKLAIAVAQNTNTGVKYATLAEAVAAAEAGETVVLLGDVALTQVLEITKSIILDGAEFTLSSTADRAINVITDGEVTIQNLTIECSANTERAVNVIKKPATVNLINVTVPYAKYAVNVASSAANGGTATVNVENSNITGYAAVNLTAEGTVLNVKDSVLTGNGVAGETNDFGTIAIQANNVTVKVTGGKVIAQGDENQSILQVYTGNTGANVLLDTELVYTASGIVGAPDTLANNITLRAEYADTVVADGYTYIENGANLIDLKGTIVAVNLNTGKVYAELNTALLTAQAGQTVQIVVDLNEMYVFVPNVTLDLNGHILTATYVSAGFTDAHIIDSSENNTGRLVVAEANLALNIKNAQLPIKTEEGYVFADVGVRTAVVKGKNYVTVYAGMNLDSDPVLAQLIKNASASGLQLEFRIKVEWTSIHNDNPVVQYFSFLDSTAAEAADQWVSTGAYRAGLGMRIYGTEDLTDVSFTAVLVALDANGNEVAVFEG